MVVQIAHYISILIFSWSPCGENFHLSINTLQDCEVKHTTVVSSTHKQPNTWDNPKVEQIKFSRRNTHYDGSPGNFILKLSHIHIWQLNEVWYSFTLSLKTRSKSISQQFSKVKSCNFSIFSVHFGHTNTLQQYSKL